MVFWTDFTQNLLIFKMLFQMRVVWKKIITVENYDQNVIFWPINADLGIFWGVLGDFPPYLANHELNCKY